MLQGTLIMPGTLAVVLVMVCTGPLAVTVHFPDNSDGTYSNPVMPNAHWSDPSAIRVGRTYYLMSSSVEVTPVMSILQSTDLVH